MNHDKKLTILGKEISEEEIEKLHSVALKKILKQQLEECDEEGVMRRPHETYHVYSRYSKSTCICIPLMGL